MASGEIYCAYSDRDQAGKRALKMRSVTQVIAGLPLPAFLGHVT